jgi:hypothetical protein
METLEDQKTDKQTGSARRRSNLKPTRLLSYLFEFILVFLAVVGGFLFDSIREGKKERMLEHQIMVSLLEDLRVDQGRFGEVRMRLGMSMSAADSLIKELNSKPLKGHEKKLYHFYNLYNIGDTPPFTDRTFVELKYSGNYSVIQNKEVADALIRYEKEATDARWLGFYGTYHTNNSNNVTLLLSQVFDFTLARKFAAASFENTDDVEKVGFPENISLLTYDPNLIAQTRNYITVNRGDDEFGYQGNDRLEKMNRALDSLISVSYSIK